MLSGLLKKHILLAVVAVLSLGGCATLPSGPSVLVLPSTGKSLEQFQGEDLICRQWAGQQVGMSAQDMTNTNTVTGAAVGTMIGAGAGALMGAASGRPGAGAAIGAGSGLLFGTAAGAGGGQEYGWEAQKRYDFSYIQCMYSKGNQIPGQVHQYRIREVNPPRRNDMNTVPPDYVPGYQNPR